MFSPKQLVVYPAQGVGVIERIERKEVGGAEAEFYIVRIMGNNITLMVPVGNAANVGLRPLCDAGQSDAVMESLKDRASFSGYAGQNWNRRHREYSERLKSGQLSDVCHVLKELYLIGGEKELSFGERRLLEQALGLVSMEVSCVTGCSQEEIKQKIESYFADVLIKEEKNL